MKRRAAAGSPTPVETTGRLEARIQELTRTLRISEEARAILADQYDFAPVGFVNLDDKGCVREINLTATRMLGRERASLLGMPFFPLIAKSHVGTFLRHLGKCRARVGDISCETGLRTRSGATLAVELRSVPVLDPRFGDTVYRTMITEITERQRASQALRESEERYRELVDFSPDGIFIVSAGQIVFASRAAQRLCQVEHAEALIGGEFIVWARPAHRPALSALLEHPIASPEVTPVETSLIRADGTKVEVEVIARPLHHGERMALVVVRDISRRKTAERHVLQISERERTEFGRDLHDGLCQNLLGAALIAEGLRRDLKDTQSRVAGVAETLARVVRDCGQEARNFARGLAPVTMEQHGLAAALHDLVADVGQRLQIHCTLHCDENLTIENVSRATHLYRITQEAISNAIRHGHAKSVHIYLGAENGRMSLRVEDDGRGIPAKLKKTGMGLHTMRYRASLIGGALEVRRKRPRGTVVSCNFPTHQETP